MNTDVQREVMDWYHQWNQINCTKDEIMNLNRGPFRDFQLSFLLPRARTNAFIETYRTNAYLKDANDNEGGDFMEKEVNTALFASKLDKLKELEKECSRVQAEAEIKHAKLQRKRMETPTSGSYAFQRQYYSILDERLNKTKALLAECNEMNDDSNSTLVDNDNQSRLPALAEAAHLAFQSVVMRHYLYDTSSPRVGGGSLTADEFRTLVISVIQEDFCGSKALQWVDKERTNFLKSSEEYAQKLIKQNQQHGLQQSLSDKMDDLIIAWSAAHVQAYFKNKSREKLLLEANQALQASQQAYRSDSGISYRLSDFLGLIRKKCLAAKVERCRQHNSRSGQPLDNIFRNVSSDRFSTPSPENDIDDMFINLRRQWNMREWVLALSDSEQIEEIYVVLVKTWSTAKQNLVDMISFAQQPRNELLTNFLQTAECIKVNFPKPIVHKPAPTDRRRCNVSDQQVAQPGSTLSVTYNNTATLNLTCVSSCTALSDSLSESRVSSSAKDSSNDSIYNDTHVQELYSLFEKIPENNLAETTSVIQSITENLHRHTHRK